jgi:hypothetical protein
MNASQLKTTSMPWALSHAEYDQYSNCFICSIRCHQFVFAKIAGRTKEECDANGALFFASKDLFNSACQFVSAHEENDIDALADAADLADKAIKEASGNEF